MIWISLSKLALLLPELKTLQIFKFEGFLIPDILIR